MTPDDVRQRIVMMQPFGQSDPERWHSDRDQLHRDVLTSIRDGHPAPAALADAALDTEQHERAWEASA
ncbi:hypothetical protein [Micromonospora rubida]